MTGVQTCALPIFERADKQRLEAHISDPLSGLSSFNAYVNDEWVLMNYDYKRNLIWSDKLVDSVAFAGELRLEVADRAGNIATLQAAIQEKTVQPALKKKQNAASKRSSPRIRGQRPKRKRR